MLETCRACGTRYAPGLAACPHCGHPAGEEGDGDGEEDGLPKITHEGVSFPREPDYAGFGDEDPAGSHAGDEEGPEETPDAAEAVAENVPPSPAPARPPRMPPRRPPAVTGSGGVTLPKPGAGDGE